MLIGLLINLVVLFAGVILSWLPDVVTLPTIGGVDIDGALLTGMGQFNTLITVFWVIGIAFKGFLVLMSYYIMKMSIKVFLGSRTPHK